MSLCPCKSRKNYDDCCGLYIEKKQTPHTPEQLMRSRYAAYSLAKVDYIKQTMKGNALLAYNEAQAKEWALNVIWLDLKILQAYEENPQKGFVEFAASFIERNQINTLHELSEFHKDHDTWFYVDGTYKHNNKITKQKIGRNSPCPCGAGKKFKNCHER